MGAAWRLPHPHTAQESTGRRRHPGSPRREADGRPTGGEFPGLPGPSRGSGPARCLLRAATLTVAGCRRGSARYRPLLSPTRRCYRSCPWASVIRMPRLCRAARTALASTSGRAPIWARDEGPRTVLDTERHHPLTQWIARRVQDPEPGSAAQRVPKSSDQAVAGKATSPLKPRSHGYVDDESWA